VECGWPSVIEADEAITCYILAASCCSVGALHVMHHIVSTLAASDARKPQSTG
jgi:hypothetical protein